MSDPISRKSRRGTTAEHSSFTGLAGEVTVDTTKKVPVVHDGSTAGGFPLAASTLSSLSDNTISIAKLAATSNGQLFVYDPNGQLTTLNLGSANQALRVNSSGNGLEWASLGGITYAHVFKDSTRNINLTGNRQGTYTPITWQFTKQRSDTALLYSGFIPISGQYSYHSGERIQFTIGGSTHTNYLSNNYVSPPANSGDDSMYGILHFNGYVPPGDLGNQSGTCTMGLGWSARNGAAECPGNYWNHTQASSRIRGYTTNVVVYEVDPGDISFVT